MSEKKVKLCELCEEQPATVLCAECSKCYCEECNEYVHKKASKKSHKTESLQESVRVDMTCPLHNDPLRMFCIDEVQLCCVMCKEKKLHEGHNVVELSEIAQDNEVFSAEEVKKHFADVLKCGDELEKKIEEVIESIRSEGVEAKKKIEQTFTEEHNKLRDKEAKTMEELEKEQEKLKDEEAKFLKEIEDKLNKLKEDEAKAKEELRKTHEKLKEEEAKVIEEIERVCNENEEVLQKNLEVQREIREYSRVLSETDVKGNEGSRLMELNLVSSMEKQRRTMEELHKTIMTDLKIGWNSEERKLSFTKTLFNGAPVPNDISFSSVLSQQMTISWECDDGKLCEEDKEKVKFVVEMKKGGRGSWREAYTGTNKKCSVSDLEMDTEYNVRVKCVVGNLQGRWSEVASDRTKTISTPTFFTTKSKSWNSITLTWNAVENASLYQIEVDGSGSLETSTNTTYIKRGLPQDTEHNFRVRAVCGREVGKWSVAVKGRTKKFINIISDILSKEKNENVFKELIGEWCKASTFELLYRGTRDGFGRSDFYGKCENRGKTIILVKNISGHIFGGFASIPWVNTSSDTWKQAPGSFIFTLSNMYGIQPTKFPLKNENDSNAICHDRDYGPVFGSGRDLVIKTNSNANTNSYTNFSETYNDTTGKGRSIFSSSTSTNNFQVQEIEVFRVNV